MHSQKIKTLGEITSDDCTMLKSADFFLCLFFRGGVKSMKIIFEKIDDSGYNLDDKDDAAFFPEEEQITVRYRHLRPELMEALASINSQDTKLIAYEHNEVFKVDIADVYYIEVVDGKVFLYAEDKVYESKHKLAELEKQLEQMNFLRVSRTVLLSINKVRSFSPALNGRLKVTLQNDEKLLISRRYVLDLKASFGV
jgi:hypothetical protein